MAGCTSTDFGKCRRNAFAMFSLAAEWWQFSAFTFGTPHVPFPQLARDFFFVPVFSFARFEIPGLDQTQMLKASFFIMVGLLVGIMTYMAIGVAY